LRGLTRIKNKQSAKICVNLRLNIPAAFLCAESGIANKTINNSSAYLQSWLKTLSAKTGSLSSANT
jgi:antirestriction protein ArdC